MMSDYDFVIFLSGDWDTFFRRYLLRVLANKRPMSKVLCVDRPVCLVSAPMRAPARWIKQIAGRDRRRKLAENLFVYTPWVFLHDHVAAKLPIVPELNREWLREQLKRVMGVLGLREDRLITWIYDPFQEDYLGLLNERLSVYECYDEYTACRAVPFLRTRNDLKVREKRILNRADLTFVVSEALLESKRAACGSIHLVPNAVDVEHFALAHDDHTKLGRDVIGISHPIMGYLGNLTDRIDFVLIIKLAQAHPEWSLVFVGGAATPLGNKANRQAVAELQRMQNVHFLGSKPYEELPSYLKAFDVCLIPYVAEDLFNIHCSPLKLYEYLATGKPTVSTDLPAVRPFDGVVYIGRDTEEFERQVAAALEGQDEGLRQQRLAAARENSWERRAKRILDIIEATLEEEHS